jgi:MFS transporter, ACS family, tartrate transporter
MGCYSMQALALPASTGDCMTGEGIAGKVRARVAWPCMLFLLMSSLDRANISFAAASMNADLGFTPSQYGFGAGVLFAGFLAGQYPSLFLLQRIGMRAWMSACALLWGLSSGAMAFIDTHAQFYALRVLIGVAEGGLAPGIVIYLSQFATDRERATTFSLPMIAIPVSVVIGAPLSGWLLSQHTALGMPGWRFMFLAEAVPTLIAGCVAAFYFPNSPEQARWLSPDERDWLGRNAARRAGAKEPNDWRVLREPLVPLAGVLWFCLLSGSYGVIFWLPQILRALTGYDAMTIGFVGALPWVGAALGMYFNANHSDRSGERAWHIALPALVAAGALGIAWLAGGGVIGLGALVLAGIGLGAAQGAFWALPTSFLAPASFAVAVVAINTAGSAGGLVMPQLMGIARERSGGFAIPTLLVVAVLLFASVLVGVIAHRYRPRPAASAET